MDKVIKTKDGIKRPLTGKIKIKTEEYFDRKVE